jgi:hypothetical protein
MEDRVYGSHGVRELESEGMGAGLSNDLERAEILLREFLSRTCGTEELCFDEYLISDLEVRSWKSIGIGRSFVSFLRGGDLGLEDGMEFVKICSKFFGPWRGIVCVGVESKSRMIALIGVKWRDASGSTRGIIEGEFCNGT